MSEQTWDDFTGLPPKQPQKVNLGLFELCSTDMNGAVEHVQQMIDSTIASVTITTILAICSVRMIPQIRFSPKHVSGGRMKELLHYGFHDTGISLARILHNCIPIWTLNRFSTPVQITNFHLAISAHRQVQKIWIPIRTTFGPPLIAMDANNDLTRMRRWFFKGGRFAIWAVMGVSTPIIIFANPLIRLYAGEAYLGATVVIALVLLRYPLQMLNGLLPQIVRAKGIPGQYARITLSAEIVLMLLTTASIVFLRYGAITAGICYLSVSLFMESCFALPLALRLVDGKVRDSVVHSLIPGIVPATIASGVWYFCLTNMETNSWTNLIIAGIPGGIVYLITIIILLNKLDRINATGLIEFFMRLKKKQ